MKGRKPGLARFAVCLAAMALAACTAPRPAPTDVAATAPPVAPNATIMALPPANDLLSRVEAVATPGRYTIPFDATPNPDGTQIFFTAESADGPGVFRVPAGGGPVEVVAQGEPLVAPRGIAIAPDGRTLFVADEDAVSNKGAGQLFVIAVENGALAPLPAGAGLAPRAVAITRERDADVLYVTGKDPADDSPLLVRLVPGKLERLIVASGAPMVEPGGLAVARDGTIYLTDRSAAGAGRGTVFRVRDGAFEPIAGGFRTGGPVVGTALTSDDQTLLISSLAEGDAGAQFLLITLATLDKAIFSKTVGTIAGAGGLHRALNRDIFAWAASQPSRSSHSGGAVYLLEP